MAFPLGPVGWDSDCSGWGHCQGADLISDQEQWVKGPSIAEAVAYVAAVAQTQHLAREFSYAVGVAMKFRKREGQTEREWTVGNKRFKDSFACLQGCVSPVPPGPVPPEAADVQAAVGV